METLFVGKNIIFLPETLSTNSYAIDLLKNVNPGEGTVVHTANQLSGKGQRGSVWMSDAARNLTASFIFKPGFLDLKNQFFLYIISALACYDTTAEILNASHFDIKIKWPNDILLNRKKVAGILIENKMQQNRLLWTVIGIGLNVNQQDFGELIATSLKKEGNNEVEVQLCLELICKHLEKYYLHLKNKKYEYLKQLYSDRLFAINETINFQFKNSIQALTVRGISDSGWLILEGVDGSTREVDVKDVKWLID